MDPPATCGLFAGRRSGQFIAISIKLILCRAAASPSYIRICADSPRAATALRRHASRDKTGRGDHFKA
jgi:hypothetical protein